MPDKCCALNCRTGYDNEKPPSASGISLFRFPKEPDLAAEWKKRITRQNWEPSARSTVCSLHFKEEDIIRERQDSNTRRTKPGSQELLPKPRLRIGAIPTIFENLPSYKNLPVPEERASAPRTSAESRRKADEVREEEHIDQFFAEDVIQSPDEVLEKAQKEVLPEGFISSKKKKNCSFFYMAESESGHDVPQLLASLTVMEDLTFSASALGKLIRPSKFQHLLQQRGRFSHFSEVANVLSALKNLAGEPEKTDWLELAGDCLSQFLDLNEDLSDELQGRVQFIKEQISLAQRKPIGSDIEDLFAQESEKPLKLAHKLSEKVVSPNAVRKASVQIANSLFHESTRDALLWFSNNEGMPWYNTAEFTNYVLTFWKIVNVRAASTGYRKRDDDRTAVCAADDEKLDFLAEFANWLETWKEQSPAQCGLSPATFLANIHTCRTLIELSRHCIEVLGFDYVLLGKFQSDALEGRFGWYRQLSGGNYYISLRQVLDNERKIKAVSLLRMSKFSLAELGRLEDTETPRLVQEKALELQQVVQTKLDSDSSTMDSSDANAVGYVAGALVRTELNQRKCQGCAELLKDSRGEKLPEIPLSTLGEDGEIQPLSANILSFVNDVNRGGLLAPSTLALSIGLKCWAVFNCIDGAPA